MQFSKLLLLLLLGSATLVSSCGEDDDISANEDVNNRLEGDWEVTSFSIDGSETIPAGVQSFDMEFEKEGPEEGELDWDIVYRPGSGFDPVRIRGDYEISNEGREMELDGGIEFDITLNGDDLELAGTVDGRRWEIEAERD